MRDQGRCWRGCGAGAQVVIFDNDQDDRLLVVQEALSEAMASAAYDGPLACVRVRLSLPPPSSLPPSHSPPPPPPWQWQCWLGPHTSQAAFRGCVVAGDFFPILHGFEGR